MTSIAAQPPDESTDLEVQRLRAALEKIRDKSRRSHDSWYPGRKFPTEYAEAWHNGFVSALASCSLIAGEALDPAAYAEEDETWLAAQGTDREWFDRTGNCGHCGNLAEDCSCTPADPCDCGPHEPRTWPKTCYRCAGTGMVDPVKGRAHTPGQMPLLVPAEGGEDGA